METSSLFVLLVMMVTSLTYIEATENVWIGKLQDDIRLSTDNNSYEMTSCQLLHHTGTIYQTKLSPSRNTCSYVVMNASSSDSGNYTWLIDEDLPSQIVKNITLTIISDKITLSHTVICSKGQDLPFVCTASDAFTINPLMELWDGTTKNKLSSSFNPVSFDDTGAHYEFTIKCDRPQRLCCKTGGYPYHLPLNFHELHEICANVLPRDVEQFNGNNWKSLSVGLAVASLGLVGLFAFITVIYHLRLNHDNYRSEQTRSVEIDVIDCSGGSARDFSEPDHQVEQRRRKFK